MTSLKLGRLDEERPVKVTVELPAAVHRDLVRYGEVLERFSSGLNRQGFTRPRFSDSRSLLAEEAGMDGSSLVA